TQQDVSWLQIAMNDAVLVSVLNCACQGFDELSSVVLRMRGAAGMRFKAASVNVFQDDERSPVVLTYVVYLHDIRMLQTRDRLGFHSKARTNGGVGVGTGENHLEGDDPSESKLPRFVDYPHAAAPELGENLVARNFGQIRDGFPRRRTGTFVSSNVNLEII